MTAPAFYIDPERLAGASAGSTITISGEEGRHAALARRLRAGEAIELVDGEGLRVAGAVRSVPGPDQVLVTVDSVQREPLPKVRVTAVVALLKGDRLESAVEMLTELGVDEIVPWSADRCIVAWRGERAARAQRRLSGTVRAAGKQSRRARFPVVAPLADTAAVVELLTGADAAVVLDGGAAGRAADWHPPTSGRIVLVSGPEGGITSEELALFVDAGAIVLRMGPAVLRAATAAVAASVIALARSGRWS